MQKRLDSIKRRLTPAVENVALLEVTDSTHAMARELIADMDEEEQRLAATVIIADRQERGEGRAGRSWSSPPGGLYLSWLRSGLDPESIARLPILAAVAAQAAVADLGIAGARIKWPNDILVEGRKLAGILVFARHGDPTWATVGLGVNIGSCPRIDEPGALPATCVSDLVGEGDDALRRELIACSFVNGLTASLARPDDALAAWRSLLLQQPGDAVTVRLASGTVLEGTVAGIEDEGYLRVRTDGEERVVTGGDIIES